MSLAEILAAHGILRAPEVVELAAVAKLDLACAATLLAKESGGGRNIWGSDPVPTGHSYDKGSPVVRGDYLAYLGAIARGAAGRQGCGPTQLTAKIYQDQADRAGGCWDWRANCLTGFRILRDLIRRYGEHNGFRAYNGSGAAADRYAADAMAGLSQWRGWLSDLRARPTITQGARGAAVVELQSRLGIAADGVFGPDTGRAVRAFQKAHDLVVDGIVGPATWARLGDVRCGAGRYPVGDHSGR